MQRLRGWIVGLFVCVGASCGPLLQPRETGHLSHEFEPPAEWESAVTLLFRDSTQVPELAHGIEIEFTHAGRLRRVTGRELARAETGEVRTPWYRVDVSPADQGTVTFRVTVGDADGRRTTAEYPLQVRRDAFYYVEIGAGARAAGPLPPLITPVLGVRAFPLPPGARRSPADSLWVSYTLRGRDCFDCPR